MKWEPVSVSKRDGTCSYLACEKSTLCQENHCSLVLYSPQIDLSDNTLSYTKNEAASSPNITPGEFSGGCGSPDVVNKEVIPMSHANSWWLTLPQVYNLSACVLSIKTRALPGSSSFYVWCCLFCESGWYEGFVFASRLHIMLLFVLRSQWFGQLNVSLIEVAGFQLIKYHIFLFSHSFYM